MSAAESPNISPPRSALNDFDTLARLLVDELRAGSALDAYLLACGLAQLADDFLHPDIHPFDRAASLLGSHDAPLARIAGRAAGLAADGGRAAAARIPAAWRVARWRGELDRLVDGLAGAHVRRLPEPEWQPRLLQVATILVEDAKRLPERLRRAVGRLPTCFLVFDQQPEDMTRLVRQFAQRFPSRGRPLLVTGVRTSGSYLAPLCAAALCADGFEDVSVLTVRPDRGLLKHERELVRSTARRGGLGLVVDDPPVTGKSLASAATELEQAGLPGGAIVLVLQVFGTRAVLPDALSSYRSVLLPSSEWAVNLSLQPPAVEEALSSLLAREGSVVDVEPVPLPDRRPVRSHARGRFRVRLRNAATGQKTERDVLVEGVGLGYLGRHTLAAARALDRFTPRVFGLERGLLYREWLPDGERLGSEGPEDEQAAAEAIAEYAAERSRMLPVPEDLSLRLAGEDPAWEVASAAMSRAFGRAWPVAKVLLTDRAAKRMLRVERPAQVDGNTGLGHWFREDGSSESLVKVNVGENLYANLGLSCFDPVFDLAGVSAESSTPSIGRRLREAYADQIGGGCIDEERWLLYELAHLWGRRRTQPGREAELRRARSQALQRYFADVYLSDVPVAAGPLCALDVDGVLETEHLGFPSLSPASALALRALKAHGYRPLLATGRSLGEVVERCEAYGLPGGVAEYGSAIHVSEDDRVRDLVPRGAAGELGRLRAELRAAPKVHVDENFGLTVRAFKKDRGGRSGLDREAVATALARRHGIRAVEGEGQTDFVAEGVDKGSGIRALASELNGTEPGSERPLAFAVGDTVTDLPMADLAERAYAPAHASEAVARSGFEVTKAPYQSGLAEAVGALIGHPPGACPACRMPDPAPEREMLLTVLAAQERGQLGMARQAAKLALQTARAR